MVPAPAPRIDRRAQIARAAIACLQRDGHARLTARAIAAEAGISRGHITYNFRDMDGVLAEAYRPTAEDLRAASAAAMQDAPAIFWRPGWRPSCGRVLPRPSSTPGTCGCGWTCGRRRAGIPTSPGSSGRSVPAIARRWRGWPPPCPRRRRPGLSMRWWHCWTGCGWTMTGGRMQTRWRTGWRPRRHR
jgi:AcrR family transcriptional regulator